MKELTKEESKLLKGIAILFMLGLHLYNRVELNGYYKPLIILEGQPLIYYISFIFDACVPIYCFCAGYAAYITKDKKLTHVFLGIKKLLVNYWVVLALTCLVGFVLKHPTIPGHIMDFLGAVLLYDTGYVGAWWFMQTYIMLTLVSKKIIKCVELYNLHLMIIITLIIYCTSYYFRMMNPLRTGIYVIDMIINTSVLLGTSLLPYICGILFRKHSIVTFLRNTKLKYKNIISSIIILLCIIGHAIVKSMVVAPFVAMILISAISMMTIPNAIKKVLVFFGEHSTNIWLVHMQLYMIFFKEVIFCTNTVIGCMVILLCISLVLSYIINFISLFLRKKLLIL